MKPTKSPTTMEHEQKGDDHFASYEEDAVSADMCNCFGLFFRSSHQDNIEHKHLLNQTGEHRETWVAKKLKKLKETSEILAGPKWKTLIRRFGAYGKNRKQKNQFQYDPESYALNFDSGAESDEDCSIRSFTTRFATPILDDKSRNRL